MFYSPLAVGVTMMCSLVHFTIIPTCMLLSGPSVLQAQYEFCYKALVEFIDNKGLENL